MYNIVFLFSTDSSSQIVLHCRVPPPITAANCRHAATSDHADGHTTATVNSGHPNVSGGASQWRWPVFDYRQHRQHDASDETQSKRLHFRKGHWRGQLLDSELQQPLTTI